MNKILALFAIAALVACGETKESNVPSADSVEKMEGISNSSLVDNPITADEVITEETAAKIELEETTFDFGKIKEGEAVTHVFKFKNTGKSPLSITNAKGSCGCTVPEWPKEPIAPNETGEINVKFDSKGKKGAQVKTVTLRANTIPNETIITIKGEVEPAEVK